MNYRFLGWAEVVWVQLAMSGNQVRATETRQNIAIANKLYDIVTSTGSL